ncbi:unnamed protein product [Linum trigynum]|uniref:Secreted protein n=1 Tax=Linum trigynum TaxID=586398 RepID=A0AAV2E055_9ROSI
MIGAGVAVLTVVAPTSAAAIISEEKGSGVASTVAMESAVGEMATRARPEVCRSLACPPVDPSPRKKETKVKSSAPEMVKKSTADARWPPCRRERCLQKERELTYMEWKNGDGFLSSGTLDRTIQQA